MTFIKKFQVCAFGYTLFLPLPPPLVIEQTSEAYGADIALFEEPEKDSETIFQTWTSLKQKVQLD